MKLKPLLDDISAKYLFRLAYLMNNYRDPWLRLVEQRFGLTRPEVTILACLGNTEGITAKDVADVTRQPKNTLSRGAVQLENKGLIVRYEDKADKRRSIMHMTETGLTLFEQIMPLYDETERRLIFPLNQHDLNELDRLLRKMCDWVAEHNDTPTESGSE
ncbi:MAG: MarR family winged helix-turn-helix transcriptional regulator [Desulfobacteraceae bacterium]|nr:MarR family winged helix-turn-helix transcriptional regulator [Desulfobacteraceae bacterium]